MLVAASPTQRSSRRPVPLIGRSDLIVSEVRYRGILHYVVKDPVGLKYHLLRSEQFRLLQLLDGEQTVESLRDILIREFPAIRPTARQVQQVTADLHQKGLAYSARLGQGVTRSRQQSEQTKRQFRQTMLNILSMRLPGWDPDAVLVKMLPYVAWMFHPIGVAVCLAFVLSSWVTLGLNWAEFQSKLPAFQQFFGWPNLIYIWLTLAGAKILHEFGHGLSCRYFGGECHEMGVMLLVFSPCLYCDVTDSWMFPNKWQRIIIGGAGMYVEVILSAIAIYIWQATTSGLLHYLALNLFFVTAVTTVIFNANPLMRLDGYYMLSDFLEIPNLRPKADQFLRDTFSHVCLGIEPQHDPFAPQTGRFWFILFAIASHVYGWLVLGGILLFLYTVLKPYELQVLGQVLASFSVGGLITGSMMMMYRVWSAPRIKPISRTRLSITLALLAIVAVIVIQFPIPWYRTSSCLIEPYDVRHVVTKVPGQIEHVFVEPGQYVEKDQLLVQLRDPEWESRLEELKSQIKVQQTEVRLHLALDDQSSRAVAIEMLEGLKRQESELIEHLSHLRIVAPCSGTVVEPPRQPSSTLEQLEVRLGKWESTPLDPRNYRAFLPERTSILSIAPGKSPDDPERYEAVVYLDQSDRLDVKDQMRMRIKLDHLPYETFTGNVRQIARAQTDVAPAALSNKQGGAMSTVTDREGQEKLEDAAYQAIIEFQDEPAFLKTGLRGQARFLVVERSLGGWLWRWIRRTFDFEL